MTKEVLAVALVLGATACSHKVSPQELASSLNTAGVHAVVSEGDPGLDPWPGSEVTVSLVLDYDDAYAAVRFVSRDLSRDYCHSVTLGVRLDQWCVYPRSRSPNMDTWHKVEALADK